MASPVLTHLHTPLSDLSEIGLLSGTLYLSGGVPQVFARIYPDTPKKAAGRWLYVPRSKLQALPSTASSDPATPANATFIGEAVSLDDVLMHPIIIDGLVRALVGVPAGLEKCPPNVLSAVLERIVLYDARLELGGNPMLEQFLGRIFRRDISPERFLAGILNFLTEQVPSGLAAAYSETGGVFRLHLAVGDIALWDKLDGALTHATVAGWTDAMESDCPFVPVGFLPDDALFLDDAPTFVYVHRGMAAERARSIIAMPVPGDLTRVQARHLIEIGRIISRLHERQFGLTDDLLSMWNLYRRAAAGERSFDDILLTVFDMIHRHVEITRLVYVDPHGNSRSVLRRSHTAPAVRHEDDVPLAASTLEAAAHGRSLMTYLTEENRLTEEEAKRYYLSNVKSELCLGIRSSDSQRAFVAVGSAAEGDRLTRVERFLETVGLFLDLCREACDADRINATDGRSFPLADRPRRAAARLATLRKLTDGYFHGIIDRLSYLLGEAEVLENRTFTPDAPPGAASGPSRFVQSIESVVDAMERIHALLGGGDDDLHRPVRATRLLADLPACFDGVSHHLQDAKNIAIRVVPSRSVRANLRLSLQEMLDFVYPVILAIMDEAICSGKIIVRATTVDDVDALSIECEPEIIGHTTLGAILGTWFDQPADVADLTGAVPVGEFTWHFDCLSNSRHRAWLVRANATPAHAATPPKTARVRDGDI